MDPPEAVERTQLTRDTVPEAAVADLDNGKVEPTLDDAHRYLTNLEEQRVATTTTSSTAAPSTTLSPDPAASSTTLTIPAVGN